MEQVYFRGKRGTKKLKRVLFKDFLTLFTALLPSFQIVELGVMKTLNEIVAENLVTLRKARGLTQQELASKINYSDKSISKWELGYSIPAVDVLKEFAEFYGVTIDFLVTEQTPEQMASVTKIDHKADNNHVVLIAMTTVAVFFTAACVYASSILNSFEYDMWVAFVWAFPLSILIAAVMTHIYWGRNVGFIVLESLFVWTLISSFFVQFYCYPPFENLWYIYLVCVPIQVGIILLSLFK